MLWVYIWLGVVAVSMIVEFITQELVSIWIAVGGLIAMILAACGVGYEIQLVVGVIVSIACIIGLRKITLKFLNRNNEKTNTDLIIGVKTKLLSDITKDSAGTIKYNGVVWSCVDIDNGEINTGEYVEIINIQGNKLIVRKFKNKETS